MMGMAVGNKTERYNPIWMVIKKCPYLLEYFPICFFKMYREVD